jgi:hypothetical protein
MLFKLSAVARAPSTPPYSTFAVNAGAKPMSGTPDAHKTAVAALISAQFLRRYYYAQFLWRFYFGKHRKLAIKASRKR